MISNYFTLSVVERRLFLKASLFLLWIRMVVFLCPFKWYAKWLGKKDQETSGILLKEEEEYILLIKDALRRAVKYHLFDPKCLAAAIVAKKLLNKKSIPSILYLGVAKNEKQKMIAHAWLRCGDVIVTGKKGMERFTVVSKFS